VGGRVLRVLRDEERDYGPAPTRFRLTLSLADELPPVEQVGTAHGLVFDGDAIVLARHVTRSWTIPGGHLEPGETPEQALHREVAEEAGAVVRDPVLLAVERIERLAGPPASDRYTNPSFQVFYGARLVSLGPPTALDECTESRRFRPEEARVAPGWVQDQRELYEEALRWATGTSG
jgi:8-oxo-dGTP diphosphatase